MSIVSQCNSYTHCTHTHNHQLYVSHEYDVLILAKIGQRALVGKVNMDIASPDNNYYCESTESSISDTLEFINFVQKKLKVMVEIY